jgi:hypothetical protein
MPVARFVGRDAGWSSQVARRAHNPKVAGSNPAPAMQEAPADVGVFSFLGRWAEAGRVPIGYQSESHTLVELAPREGSPGQSSDARGVLSSQLRPLRFHDLRHTYGTRMGPPQAPRCASCRDGWATGTTRPPRSTPTSRLTRRRAPSSRNAPSERAPIRTPTERHREQAQAARSQAVSGRGLTLVADRVR